MSRTIAIGDVHGCADEFEELLEVLELKPKDRVIQLGDLINRGPDSRRAIQLASRYKVEVIIGNHELRLLKSIREKRSDLLKGYDVETLKQLRSKDLKFLSHLPNYIYDKKREIVFVHGGFLPDQPWETQPTSITAHIQVIDASGRPTKRSKAPNALSWADHWKGAPFVVYGHTPRPTVYKRPSSIGIDTGCVYGGRLTAYIVEDKSFVQVDAHKAYAQSNCLLNSR